MALANIMATTIKNPSVKNDDKGSIGNRIEYAGKQAINYRKALVKDKFTLAAGTAATAGATMLTAKSKRTQEILCKVFEKIKTTKAGTQIKELLEQAAPHAKKGLNTLKNLPGPAKAVLGIGAALTAIVVEGVHNKGIYKAGKIDQEYTDKAKMQEILN